jgi:hypothetical protein
MYEPPKPDGRGAQAEWARLVTERVIERLRIAGGPGVKVSKTTGGVMIEIEQQAIKNAAGSSESRWS